MDEALLFAYLQEHGPFAEWVVESPLFADQVVSPSSLSTICMDHQCLPICSLVVMLLSCCI